MGKEQNTAKQIIDNLLFEAESLKEYIDLTKDNTMLFMLTAYDIGDRQKIYSVLLGNYGISKEVLARTMQESPEVAEYVMESLLLFLKNNSNINAKVIRIPSGSSLGTILKALMKGNDKNNDQNS